MVVLLHRFEIELENKPDMVQWFVNKMEITPTQRYEMKSVDNKAHLLVHDLTPADRSVTTINLYHFCTFSLSMCSMY